MTTQTKISAIERFKQAGERVERMDAIDKKAKFSTPDQAGPDELMKVGFAALDAGLSLAKDGQEHATSTAEEAAIYFFKLGVLSTLNWSEK
jgi:hypothetical protein